jgi:hypothetical protein
MCPAAVTNLREYRGVKALCRTLVALTIGVSVAMSGMTGPVGAKTPTTTRKKVTTKQKAASVKRVTTRRTVTTRSRVTVPPTTVRPTTVRPTTVAPTTVSTTLGPIATTTTTPGLLPVGSTTPGLTTLATSSPIGFESPSYTITMAAGTNLLTSFFMRVGNGFTDTIELRVPVTPAGLAVRFDPNPTRNFVTMALQSTSASQPVAQFQIGAYASANPSVLLAVTNVTVFVTGTTTPSAPIDVSAGDPNAAPGIITGVSPSSLTIERGGDAVGTQIDFVRQGRFSGPIRLEVASAVPKDLITSFKYVDALQNVNYFFVSAGRDTPAGTYTIVIAIISSLGRSSIPVQVTVR